MSESWDDYADGWDSNKAVIIYSEKAYKSLLNIIDLEGSKVLDFGCGTGLLTERMSHQAGAIVAIDPSEKMISVLKGKCLNNVYTINAELTQKIIDENEALSSGFDIIVASSALAFVPDYQETLKLLQQLLKKGGILVQWDWLKENEEPGVGFSRESLELAFGHAGFSKYSTSVPFTIKSSDDDMEVVMGIAEND